MKDTTHNPNIRDEHLLTLKTIAGLFFCVGCLFATFIFTGLDAGSNMWLYGAGVLWAAGIVMGGVAHFLEQRGSKSEGREQAVAMAKSA